MVGLELGLLAAATAVNGMLAGLSVDRSLVQLPAWERIHLLGFHEYSQQADIRRGVVLYPVVGLSAAALSIAAAAGGYLQPGIPYLCIAFLYASAALAILHTFTTTRAGPNMWRLRDSSLGSEDVRLAFDGFKRWQDRRAALQLLNFMTILMAIVAFF
jgi:hypothetical protein